MGGLSVNWQEVAEVHQNRLQVIDLKGWKIGAVAGLRRR